LRKGERRIRLQEQPFQILLMLLEHPGELVTRDEICKRLWPSGTIVEFEHSIATAIKKLRQALDDEAESPRYVETLPRRGFRFIFPKVDSARVVEEPSAASPPVTSTSEAGAAPLAATRARRGWRRKALAGFALALVCVLGWPAWRFLTAPRLPAREMLDTSSLVQVTASPGADRDPSLSADGSLLAYSSDQSGSFEIYVKSLAPGGRAMQLTSDRGQNFQPAWSPDGKLIAYYSQKRGGIWLIPALGGSARLLVNFGSSPAWSPDGATIVFQSVESGDLGQTLYPNIPQSATLWIIASQGGAPVQLTRPGHPAGGHGDPVWSPDGKRIVFSTMTSIFQEMYSVSANGGEPRRLLPLAGLDLVYAPNGRALYFLNSSKESWHLMRVPLSPAGDVAGAPETIANTGNILYRHLRFSGDGRFAAFSQLSSASNLQSVRISPATAEAIGVPEPLTHEIGRASCRERV
jgi:DNA-binding winged helix-turn-helix (wHTH) protein